MSTIHLVVGPLGADRLARLVAGYREVTGFGAALFLARTRRLADEIRPRLVTGILPQVFDLQAFADELVRTHNPAVRPHSDIDRRLMLDDILAELRDERAMPYFAQVADTRGFASGAGGYVEELKEAGVDLRALLKASRGGSRYEQATKLFDRYQRRLAKRHRYDPVDRLGRAAELWGAGVREPFARVRAVFVAGFRTLAPFERKLLDALRDSVEHFWIELPEGDGECFTGSRELRAWASGAVGEVSLFDPGPEVEVVEAQANPARKGGGSTQPTALAGGVRLIEAPGDLGEVRLVARHIRTLLAEGTPPERVLVVARNFTPPAIELFREVFDEYGIPHEAEGAETLARVPAVAFLLRAVKLPDDDWPFAPLAAVLRSAYFRPAWPEGQSDPEVAAKSETLLRMLGEPRGREAYLDAVRAWEHTPPDALEDEQAEERERRKKQQLAARCRPFLERFFKAWDRLKSSGTAEASVSRLKAFTDDIGLSLVAKGEVRDREGLARFWRELDRWAKNESADTRKPLRLERFARVLSSVAAVPCRGRSARDPGRVRLLSAENAVGLECDFLFLIQLGEGSWPRLSAAESLLDDNERERLRNAGFELPDPSARLGSEQLLFRELIAAPQRGLVLSYAAVDEQGQPLLPSTFLRELLASGNSIAVTRQRMLLDGYFTQVPMSDAQARVQWAREVLVNRDREGAGELFDNLSRAQAAADARFRSDTFGSFDGVLRHPAVTEELAKRFGSEKVFSPTALETYVACPFRFWLEHVLKLDPLEDPAEEVEHTRRGAAFHRALARFHKWVNENVPQTLASAELPEAMTDELQRHIAKAVGEYAARAPSRASRELWLLEGKRLARAAARYRDHWHEFRKPWMEKKSTPAPFALEADFGVPGENVPDPLVLTVGNVEVRIGGRIDRVDVAEAGGETGFWVIDYKTGRATNYSASQVEKFEKLQLPLYALAVERVLLKDKPARPLGLAYWLVTDTGHKPMLPSGKRAVLSWLADPAKWHRFREQLESWVTTLVTHIRGGDFPLAPRSEHCTDTCPFGPVCRIAQSRHTGKVFPLALPVLPKEKDAKAE
ncbi:MAG: PD-(D/E)XK nuclease family protein [Planctomycetia bacterium]|nr:PD-(D/E)XK nuclease family protein [Planctomycetia bacterium]